MASALPNSTQTPQHWTVAVADDRIAQLTFDKPNASANSLSRAALEELSSHLAQLQRLELRGLVITSGKPKGFIAGADVREFTSLSTPEQTYTLVRAGQQVLEQLEKLPFPTAAAINGYVLGGGLELALACTYIVAASDADVTLGFPEVQLGIHPGFGGTVRSIRRMGPIPAMEMMLTGKTLRAEQALRLRLVDRLVASAALLACAREIVLQKPAPRRAPWWARLAGLAPVRPFIAARMRREVQKRARADHYPAPYALIDLWQRHGARGKAAYEAEARSISQLFVTPTSRNLVRVFLLRDRLKNLGSNSTFKAQHVHVVGAGVMGGDIATWSATRNLQVSLQDREMRFIEPALQRAREFVSKRYKDDKRDAVMSRLAPDVQSNQVPTADVVIEAIYENADAKRQLYAQLEPRLQPHALLATNTSSIVLESLADALRDPSRLVGLHFFNPVMRMPLVEVVRGAQTRSEVFEAALAFVHQLDKLPVPCRSAPGFVVNRILMPYLTEAMLAMEQGISPTVIDRAALDFGMPMGPVELGDVVGLDIALHVGRILSQAFGKPAPKSIQTLVEQKKLGKKSGEGFYVWRDGKPQKPETGEPTPRDLQDRLILPMVNEAVAVLREGIVDDADLVDAAVIFGTGFAPFRGGPLQYARSRGVAEIVKRLDHLAGLYGPHLHADAGWQLLR